MQILALLLLSLTVALGLPLSPPDVAQNAVLPKVEQRPLLGDLVPVQGHVEVENPAPQAGLSPKEHQQGMAPEVKVKEVKEQPEVKVEEVKVKEVKEQPEVKVEEVKEQPEVKVEEVKEQPEVKVEEVKEQPEVKVEEVKVEEVKEQPEVKVEEVKVEEVKEQPEVKVEEVKVEEVKEQPEVKVEEVKVEEVKEQPEVKVEEVKVEEVKEQPEVKVEEVKEQPEVKVEELVEEPEVQVELEEEPEVQVELEEEPEVQVELEEEPEVQVELEEEPEVQVELEEEPEVQVELEEEPEVEPDVELDSEVLSRFKENPEEESEAELVEDPDLRGESEVEVEPEPEALGFQAKMSLEEESDYEEAPEEEEGEYEPVGEEAMELEPLDDDAMIAEPSDAELDEAEKTIRAAFLGPDAEVLPPRSGAPGQDAPEPDPVMEMEAEVDDDVSPDQYDAGEFDGGPALDMFGQPISPSEEYFPDEEARVGMRAAAAYGELEDPVMEDHHVLDEGAQFGVVPERQSRSVMSEEAGGPAGSADLQKQGRCCCTGVTYEGKCYQFFNEPRRAADAEVFCQNRYPGGHLASITSQHIHRAVMEDMQQKAGTLKRTWVGGVRYLDTGRFIWLDGAHWRYADWLNGEPNNTSHVEDCIELLPFGNGKFNDFTCWEPQAFICSFPL